MKWTAIVLTCQNKHSANACQKELETRQQKGFIDEDVLLLTVEDPASQVGSGGATLNALLVVSEHLSAKQGYTVINSDVLQNVHILIMHLGRDFPFDACGKAFTTLPVSYKSSKYDSLLCNFDFILDTVTNQLAPNTPPGVWVCSTDMFITVSDQPFKQVPLSNCDIMAISVPGDPEYAKAHGVYKMGPEGSVEEIIFRGSTEEIAKCANNNGKVPIAVGVMYLSPKVAEKLSQFHYLPPLDACTYMGLDSGAKPLELSLFYDFLLPMCSAITEQQYVDNVEGKKDTPVSMATSETDVYKRARRLLWRNLSGLKLKAVLIEDGGFEYLARTGEQHRRHVLECPLKTLASCNSNVMWQNMAHSHITKDATIDGSCVVLNSMIEGHITVAARTTISHCDLKGHITVGKGCVLNNVALTPEEFKKNQFSIPDDIVLQGFHIKLSMGKDENRQYVLVVFGVHDILKIPIWQEKSTFCNRPWYEFLRSSGVTKHDLWPAEKSDNEKSLFNAKLFPVLHIRQPINLKDITWLMGMDKKDNLLDKWRASWRLSLEEILKCVDLALELKKREDLFYRIGCQQIWDVLQGHSDRTSALLNLFNSAAVDGHHQEILETLDKFACSTSDPGLAARTLAQVADVLGFMANKRGGMRSGPAANKAWSKAYKLLEQATEESIREGVRAMAEERQKWLDRPEHLIRAARHYEGAAHILIRKAVQTVQNFITITPTEPIPMNKWVIAEAPARADFAGGWSDTPPITYEHGGAVVDLALLVDGKKPIGVKVRRIPVPVIISVIGGEGGTTTRVCCEQLSDLENYNKPHAPAALVKAVVCMTEIVDLMSSQSLEDQLTERYQGGFEIETWSNLPRGSGLGTSSILAGAAIAALGKAVGKHYDTSSLLHAVLNLEQLMTTGGGWQDQIGGIVGGIKIGHSKAGLPLFVDYTPLNVSKETMKALNERLILVYTGTTRLARNILQNCIRNWYARDPDIVETEDKLVNIAWESARALEAGDFAKVGECLNTYWVLKVRMATGSDSATTRAMMAAIAPYAYGSTLAGAGGGGFMYILTKEPNSFDVVKEALAKVEGADGATVHRGTVDVEGLTLRIEDANDFYKC
ncbi:L-fucose kinase-like isoform X2 [Lingula anatina]|uniref:L-fucose kinase-like isoform X2 n=1 Tax=Lingula anatina TaxID=7574 RepID=A0A1S3HLT9_LINAN|nr:L-fucose kinase-like isoform X2 [Lingula anatina]|eukprot:XP_013387060.1 L-fucose kinase-like isoform X2 [Lingula anatina]